MTARVFHFEQTSIDLATGRFLFDYGVEFEDGHVDHFTEVLTLDDQLLAKLPTANPEAVARCIDALHLALGMSYWKMYCPPKIMVNKPLTAAQATFWNTVYRRGLSEFFYTNQIDFRNLISFPSDETTTAQPINLQTSDRAIANIGGGKDSIVAVELIKKAGLIFDLFTLATSSVQQDVSALIGQQPVVIARTLDPEMVRRSKAKEVLNGHIPITTIYTLTSTLVAILTGSRYAILANERSADVGNIEYLGETANHQWSKSVEAEKLFRDYIHQFITPDVTAFSILRPLSELEIIRRFSNFSTYFTTFSSCNRNFRQQKPLSQRTGHAYWCGACPKCAFVFAGLAAFLPKATVIDIFGKNLFADAKLLPLFRELLGIANFKPFECVGTPEETIVAFAKAHLNSEHENDIAMEMYIREAAPDAEQLAEMTGNVFSLGDTSLLPEPFRRLYEPTRS